MAQVPEPAVARFLAQLCDPRQPLRWVRARHLRVWTGWRLEDRVLDDHIAYLVGSGRLRGSIAGGGAEFAPGDFFFIAAGVRHALAPHPASPRPELHLVRFGVDGVPPPWRWLALRRAGRLRAGFAAVVGQAGAAPLAAVRRRALLVDLIAAAEQLRLHGGRGLSPSQLAALDRFVDQQPRRLAGSTAALAAACGLSQAWFARRFAACFGQAPRTWLAQRRAERAAALLAVGADAAAAARGAGYGDLAAFRRAFRRAYGLTPGEYRAQCG